MTNPLVIMSDSAVPLLPQSEKEKLDSEAVENGPASDSLDDLFPKVLSCMQKPSFLTVDIGSIPQAVIDFEEGVFIGTQSGEVLILTLEGGKTLLGTHQASVNAVDVRGAIGTSGGADGFLTVWNLPLRKALSSEKAHEGGVGEVHILRDGEALLSVGLNGEMKLWTTSPLEEMHCFSVPDCKIVTLCASSDNTKVVTGSDNGSIKVWNLDDRSELATFAGHTSRIVQIVEVAASHQAITGDIEGNVKVWSFDSMKEIATLIPFGSKLRSLSVTPNEKWLIGAGDTMSVYAWSLKNFTQLVYLIGHNWSNYYCKALTDTYVLTTSGDKSVRIWDMRTNTTYAVLGGHSREVRKAFVNIGEEKLFAVVGRTVCIWNVDVDKSENIQHHGSVKGICVSTSAESLATCSVDCTAKVWDTKFLKVVKTMRGHTSSVSAVCLSHSGKRIATGAENGEIKIWEVDTETEIESYAAHKAAITFIARAPNSDLFFSGDSNGLIVVWSFLDCKKVADLRGHTDAITRIVPSVVSSHIISSAKDEHQIIWNVKTFQVEKSIRGNIAWGLDADSDYIVVGDNQKLMHLYRTSNFEEIGSENCTTSSIWAVAILPRRDMCVTGCSSGYIHVWDLQPLALFQKWSAHNAGVNMLMAIKNSPFFVSAAYDDKIKIWSIEALQCVAVFKRHSGHITGMELSPCGNYLFTCGEDGKLCRHDIFLFNNSHTPPAHTYQTYTGNYLFAQCLEDLKQGKCENRGAAERTVLPLKINALHVSAYYNQTKQLSSYLRAEVPIVYGAFGSPLSVALRRNTKRCIDEIVMWVNCLLENGKGWISMQNITDDLPHLIKKTSPHILTLFTNILRKSQQVGLPLQIVPLGDLPLVQFQPTWRVTPALIAEMDNGHVVTKGSESVEFLVAEFRWNFAPGSPDSVQLLSALTEVENTDILKTRFVQELTRYKWNQLWTVTFLHTLLYTALLVVLTWMTFLRDATNELPSCLFLSLNGIFILYEVLQMITGGLLEYWKDPWNYVDVVRMVFSVWFGVSSSKDLNLLVVALCFFRGFTFFRTFKMTRMFVLLILDVVYEMHSFLIILAYSTLSFGMIYAVLFKLSSPVQAWTMGYMVLMGDYTTEGFGFIQWLCFTAVTLVNIIIMLNLLISVLGDAYGKAQECALVNDTLAQLSLILEYESLIFWQRQQKSRTVLHICQCEEQKEEDEERSYLDGQFEKVIQRMDSQFDRVNGQIAQLQGRLDTFEGVFRAKTQ